MRESDCRHYHWFYNKLKLLDHMEFSYHETSPIGVPRTKDERECYDYHFINEARLEERGWRSVSLNLYSPYEMGVIAEWCAQKGKKKVYLAVENDDDDEIYALVGQAITRCRGVTAHPDVFDELLALLASMPERPCLAVFEGCTELPQEVVDILKGKNAHIVVGQYGVAVSFEIISEADYDRIIELETQLSKRDNPPPPTQWTTSYTISNMKVVTTYYASA
jgi:hypothetical protein